MIILVYCVQSIGLLFFSLCFAVVFIYIYIFATYNIYVCYIYFLCLILPEMSTGIVLCCSSGDLVPCQRHVAVGRRLTSPLPHRLSLCVGVCWCQAPQLSVYVEFCSQRLLSKTLLDRMRGSQENVRDFLVRCQESPFSRKLDLWGLLGARPPVYLCQCLVVFLDLVLDAAAQRFGLWLWVIVMWFFIILCQRFLFLLQLLCQLRIFWMYDVYQQTLLLSE